MSSKTKSIIKLIIKIFSIPFILISLVFIGIGSYSLIINNVKGKDYIETSAKFKEYTDCHYDTGMKNEMFYGVYEYKVNYSTFNVKTTYTGTKNIFKDTIIIKYNPNNYKEYITKSEMTIFLYIGLGALLLVVFINIIFNVLLKDKKIEI